MKDIFALLSRFLLKSLTPAPAQEMICGRSILKFVAFSCLILGYVFSCRALYFRLHPYWGEALSLLTIGGLLALTSFVLFIIVWFLKSKNSSENDLITKMIKSFGEIMPMDISKNRLSIMMTLFTVAAVTYYFWNFPKKRMDS